MKIKNIIRLNLNLLLLLILISGCIGNFEDCKFELKENDISPTIRLDSEQLKELTSENINKKVIKSEKQSLVYNPIKKKYEIVTGKEEE